MAARDEIDIPLPEMAPSYRILRRRREEMDPATRRLAAFAGVIGGSLLLLVGVWSFTGHRHASVPVIEADSRPLRVKPINPGGLQVDGANDSILSGDTGAQQTLAPPPETPAPQALKAQEETAAAPPALSPSAPVLSPSAAALSPSTSVLSPPAASPPAVGAAPQAVAVAPSPPVRPEPQPAPVPHTVTAAPVHTPTPAAPVAGTAIVAPHPAAGAPAHAGGALVQLAALHSQEAALAEWQRLAHKYPDLLGGRRPAVSKTEHAGQTFWRLRTGGFADVAQAAVFCDRIKTKGGGCSIANF